MTTEIQEAAKAADEFGELQWGRGLVTTEIEAARLKRRSPAMLQWGRGLVTTEMATARGPPEVISAASMGPWPGDHGNTVLAGAP